MLLLAYGTRPEFIKVKGIYDALISEGLKVRLARIGQHTGLLGDSSFDYIVSVPSSGESDRGASIVRCVIEDQGLFQDVSHTIIEGDTYTTLAIAVASFVRRIPVMHVEAGIRTNDRENPYPEEIIRRVVSQIAEYHFCPTLEDSVNLLKEVVVTDKVFITGNPCIDRTKTLVPSRNNKVYVTLHRRENHGYMPEWFTAIDSLAEEFTQLEFILISHPNPNVLRNLSLLKRVKIEEPQDYDVFLQNMSQCRAVITDSGGIQEECNSFGKPCFVCRKVTERPCETSIICTPKTLPYLFRAYVDHKFSGPCRFGDGTSAKKIGSIVKNLCPNDKHNPQ